MKNRSAAGLLLFVAVSCTAAGEPEGLDLGDLDPAGRDSAVVVLERNYSAPHGIIVNGGVAHVYSVVSGTIPHVARFTSVELPEVQLTLVVSELYTTGPVQVDGQVNSLSWTAPDGMVFVAASECVFAVTQAFVLGEPSELRAEADCRLRNAAGHTVRILTKSSRFLTQGGASGL